MNRPDWLADCRWVLLDFDGPVCSAFAGYPAPMIASHLLRAAAEAGIDLATQKDASTDPHEVLRSVSAISPGTAHSVELVLQDAELVAVQSATPTPGAKEFLERCAATSRRVAVVSNNHGPAVESYLRRLDLAQYVEQILGRDPADVQLMKPNPHLLLSALHALGAEAQQAVFIGDSIGDMEAGLAADVHTIGYANKPGKTQRLSTAGADMIVTDMGELAATL